MNLHEQSLVMIYQFEWQSPTSDENITAEQAQRGHQVMKRYLQTYIFFSLFIKECLDPLTTITFSWGRVHLSYDFRSGYPRYPHK